jgi:hypothetical protein
MIKQILIIDEKLLTTRVKQQLSRKHSYDPETYN